MVNRTGKECSTAELAGGRRLNLQAGHDDLCGVGQTRTVRCRAEALRGAVSLIGRALLSASRGHAVSATHRHQASAVRWIRRMAHLMQAPRASSPLAGKACPWSCLNLKGMADHTLQRCASPLGASRPRHGHECIRWAPAGSPLRLTFRVCRGHTGPVSQSTRPNFSRSAATRATRSLASGIKTSSSTLPESHSLRKPIWTSPL